ncbi:MAG: cell division protein ZapB [Treponema sp.]|jgi:TolA-binding protein|nr:cell division protein ZapB [Treponema sp.]
MVNLEQVKLLEAKVAKTVEYFERLAKENAALRQREAELQSKLDASQKRVDELEVLVSDFKEDQGQIEEGILAALDRLNQFEKAIEKSLRDKSAGVKAAKPRPPKDDAPSADGVPSADGMATGSGDGQTCFEIPEENAAGGDVSDPLANDAPPAEGAAPAENKELDIF